jgi:hypothetical protein
MSEPVPTFRQPVAPPLEVQAERFAIWKDLMDTAELLLLAGLRHKIGPDGDLDAAYRAWIEQDDARRSREKYQRYKRKDP